MIHSLRCHPEHEPQPPLDSRLRRVPEGYATRDGHFIIALARGWRLRTQTPEAEAWLYAAGQREWFARRRDAIEHLRGSVYADPHGWAHHTPEAEDLLASAHFTRD